LIPISIFGQLIEVPIKY